MRIDPSVFDPIDTDPRIASHRKRLADADDLFASIQALGGSVAVEAARHRAEIAKQQEMLARVDKAIDAAGRACGVHQTRH